MTKWLVMLALAQSAAAQTPMRYIHNGPESAEDARYNYHWEILRVALEKTTPAYGPYKMESAPFMTERRQATELRANTGSINVMLLGTTPDMERDLFPIRIPVDRNLGGYSVLLARKEQLPALSKVRTLADLRRFKIGLGLGWIDVDILHANNLTVVTGSSYDGLFEMLDNSRFDAFLRSSIEVLGELSVRKARMPDLRIESTLCIYYPMPMYFWFSKTPEGRRLAARVERGMRRMIADGTYDEIFSRYQDYKITALKLSDRRILRLENPMLTPETPF